MVLNGSITKAKAISGAVGGARSLSGTVARAVGRSAVTSVNEQTGDVVLDAADVSALPSSTLYAGSASAAGPADKAVSIPMGHLDSGSTATVMTATVEGITELRDGVCMWLRNGVITSASGFTLNINNLGAKPCYSSLAAATRSTTIFNVNYTMLFVYNSTRVEGGCWDIVYGVDSNTTYTPYSLGFGYGTCTTAEATVAKAASVSSSYKLVAGGIVAIKFDNDVPANATLNVNGKGAKAIWYRGAAITAGVIKAGDTVTMVYSTNYHVLSIDRDADTQPPSPSDDIPVSINANGGISGISDEYSRADHEHSLEPGTVQAVLDEYLSAGLDMLILPNGATDGSSVVLKASQVGSLYANYAILSGAKHIAYFLIPLTADPQSITDFQIVSDATASKVYVTSNGLGIQFNGIADGKLYSAEVILPFGSDQGSGTLSATDLSLSSAQGVNF